MLKSAHSILGCMTLSFVLAACGKASSQSVSMAPIGDGLRFLGISAVVAVLVAVIGRSRRGGGSHEG
jgi:hypothetical protein